MIEIPDEDSIILQAERYGETEIFVPSRKYYIFAFIDTNDDCTHDFCYNPHSGDMILKYDSIETSIDPNIDPNPKEINITYACYYKAVP